MVPMLPQCWHWEVSWKAVAVFTLGLGHRPDPQFYLGRHAYSYICKTVLPLYGGTWPITTRRQPAALPLDSRPWGSAVDPTGDCRHRTVSPRFSRLEPPLAAEVKPSFVLLVKPVRHQPARHETIKGRDLARGAVYGALCRRQFSSFARPPPALQVLSIDAYIYCDSSDTPVMSCLVSAAKVLSTSERDTGVLFESTGEDLTGQNVHKMCAWEIQPILYICGKRRDRWMPVCRPSVANNVGCSTCCIICSSEPERHGICQLDRNEVYCRR